MILEEGNDLDSRRGWKASQVSDVPCTHQLTRRQNLLKQRVPTRKAEEERKEIFNMHTW